MPRKSPDHRALAVFSLVRTEERFPGDDPRESALFHLVKSEGEDNLILDVQEAHLLYATEAYRHVVNSMIIGDANDADIGEALRMSPLILSTYRYLFFDMAVFRHSLEIHTYVHTLTCDEVSKQHYLTSIRQGHSAVAEKFQIGERKPIEPKRAYNTVLRDLLARFQEHRGHDITAPFAQAAFRLAPEVLKAAQLADIKNSSNQENANKALSMALKMEDDTKKPEDLNLDLKDVQGLSG